MGFITIANVLEQPFSHANSTSISIPCDDQVTLAGTHCNAVAEHVSHTCVELQWCTFSITFVCLIIAAIAHQGGNISRDILHVPCLF